MSEKLKLELLIVSPGITSEDDPAVERVENHILRCRGVERAHVAKGPDGLQLCLHYDPSLVSLERLTRVAKRAGVEVGNRYCNETLGLIGMDCPDCSASIEHLLKRREGILSIAANYAAETVKIAYDSEVVSRKDLKGWLGALGYSLVEPDRPRRWLSRNRHLVLSLFCGLLLAFTFVGEKAFELPRYVAIALYLIAMVAGGYDATKHAVGAALRFRFDIDFLMVVAAIGAACLGHWADGALLLFLFSFGHALEHYAMDKARGAMTALGAVTPKSAIVIRDGTQLELPVGKLNRGDIVFVKNGERLPVDGQVVKGTSEIDQSPVTGESVPIEKTVGDEVFAGTINGEGTLEINVTKLAKDTTIARVLQMVQEAESQKAPTQRMTERFTRIFVPVVIILVLVVIILPPFLPAPLHLPARESFMRAMAILVGASPCALAIATPSAVLAGIAQAARNGVLVKGGVHLENLGTLRAIAFDKTGTLTLGRPEVTDILPCEDVDATELLRICACVESMSGHPLAQAVVQKAKQDSLTWAQPDDVVSLTGRGARAVVDGREAQVGNARLFEDEGALPPSIRRHVEQLTAEGCTTIIVRHAGRYLGVIGLADQPRPGVAAALEGLRNLGIRTLVMLTGDNRKVAAKVAESIGMTAFEAELMPEDKVLAVRDLVKREGKVAMVGDGINDAPAMKNATVGIAMGAGGTDVALETADIALMSDDISHLRFAVALSRQSRRIILQNLVSSLVVVCLLVTTAIIGITGISIAIIVHEGSTLAVVGNALRLLRFKPSPS